MVAFSWKPGKIEQNLATAERKAFSYLSKTTAYWSMRAETMARTGAKWTDRTGNARSGLAGAYQISRGGHTATFSITLAHSVSYGYWLETRNFSKAGDLSIINKTLLAQGGGRSSNGQFVAGGVADQWNKQMTKVLERILS